MELSSISNFDLINRIMKKISESPILKGVFLIGSGTAIAQVIGIMAAPIITRLYTPSDFGILITYSAIISIILMIASLRYEFAIPLPEDDIEAANLLALCILLVLITTFIFVVPLIILENSIVFWINLAAIKPYLFFFIASFLGGGLYQALIYWAVRRRNYACIAKTTLYRSLPAALGKITLGIFGWGPIGLLLGEFLSQTGGVGNLAMSAWQRDQEIFRHISLSGIRSAAIMYRRFPTYTCPASIFNTIALQTPALGLSYIYGLQVAGWYGLACGMLALPVSMISGSLSQVYFGEISKHLRDDPTEIRSIYISTSVKLALFSIPVIGIIALLAPSIFPFVFGQSWKDAGMYCLPIALNVIPGFVVGTLSNLSTYGFNHWMLIWDATRAFFMLTGFFVSYRFGLMPMQSLILLGIIMLIFYLILFILNLRGMKIVIDKHQSNLTDSIDIY
jgi:O-antigen/teichoic acid export membrane protein